MTTAKDERAHETLARLFHEPGRLAIMSALCAAGRGLPFTELRDACGLTDGNLNRHLKMLEEAGAVRVEKKFVRGRPRTTLFATRPGTRQFSDYLEALEEVLKAAQSALARDGRPAAAPAPDGALARAW